MSNEKNAVMKFPPTGFAFMGNNDVREIMVRLGISFPWSNEPSTRLVPYPYHETHWLLFVSCEGCDDENENGLVLTGMPKAIVPPEGFQKLIRDYTATLKNPRSSTFKIRSDS